MFYSCLHKKYYYLIVKVQKNIQSGASSRAKIGGAYFSVVTGSIQDTIAVLGPCDVRSQNLRN